LGVSIRRAAPADGDALLSLIRDHALFERAEASIARETLSGLLVAPAPPCLLFVAAQGDALLGYAALTLDYALWRGHCWGHLDCLYVDAAHRGRGIGEQLLAAARQEARARGADRMEWQTPDWNERAAEFYRRIGATMTSRARFALAL